MKAEPMMLKIENLNLVRDLQMRVKHINDDHANDIAADVKKGTEFPPIKVALIGPDQKTRTGKRVEPGYYVYDGFHEVEGFKRAGRAALRCDVTPMNWDQAVKAAAGANAEHNALKRTRDDKIRAGFEVLMLDPEQSNRDVAGIVKVADTFIGDTVRPMVEEELRKNGKAIPTKRVSRNGTVQSAKKKPTASAATNKPIPFDWKEWERCYAWLKKGNDVYAEVTGMKGPELQAAHAALKAYGDVMTKWRESVK